MAVRGNTVVRVGTNREIQRLRRAQTTVIDAKGGAVVPGFIDAHAHLVSGGLSLDQVSLADATIVSEKSSTPRGCSDIVAQVRDVCSSNASPGSRILTASLR